MKFTQRITVYGMKASKGDFEGVAFDSTKVYTLTGMDDTKGTAKGQAAAEYGLGDSTMYERYKHLPFPFEADADFELVSTGKQVRTILRELRPVELTKPTPAAK